jgi:hypothetical protein
MNWVGGYEYITAFPFFKAKVRARILRYSVRARVYSDRSNKKSYVYL